jgi:hypothetical protein
MTLEKATKIWQQISSSREEKLRRGLVEKTVRYARIRVDWWLTPRAERGALELTRTLAHNALIDACSTLTRAMLRAGEEIAWRYELGDDRKEIGDFACYLHAILGVAAR